LDLVQRRREFPTRMLQNIQVFVHRQMFADHSTRWFHSPGRHGNYLHSLHPSSDASVRAWSAWVSDRNISTHHQPLGVGLRRSEGQTLLVDV
jgi:hypothetical protein